MTKKNGPADYSRPLANARHERFSQEYHISLNAAGAYKIVYPKSSQKGAEASGPRLLRNVKVAGRIQFLQSKLSDACGVDARRLMEEWIKIGFANIKSVVGAGNRIKAISGLTDDEAVAISSVSTTKQGVKVTMCSKESALENMGKHIGFYGKDNEQRAGLTLADIAALAGVNRAGD